ncbi:MULTISPECIES: SDR family oxidoreductase [Actinomycetes]|uniref:NAD(P)H-binding protein n=2 Tax=Actinomycetes TaxID=1760 RepID=A0ABP6M431_9MICC
MSQRIAVLGAGGVMGSLVRSRLEEADQEVVPISRAHGVDVLDASALRTALAGVDVVVDCLNLPSLTAGRAARFFRTAAENVLAALGDETTRRGALPRIVCVSIVNCWEPRVNRWLGYYQAKSIQEQVYRSAPAAAGRISIVRTTQWFELLSTFLDQIRLGPLAVVPAVVTRPLAAAEAADVVVEQALSTTPKAAVEVCGPEEIDMARAAARAGAATQQGVRVLRVPVGRTPLGDGSLIPSAPDVVASTTFEQWLGEQPAV